MRSQVMSSDTEEKEYYVAILDKIQKKSIWGIGKSEDEVYEDCFKNLRESWELSCWPCTRRLFDFVKKHGGSEAIDNAFITEDGMYDLMSSHVALYDFCKKYKISDEAREELENMFDLFIKLTNI